VVLTPSRADNNGGALFDVQLVHTYQVPVSGCAGACTDERTCTSFTIDGDYCKLWAWRFVPDDGSSLYMMHSNTDVPLDSRNP